LKEVDDSESSEEEFFDTTDDFSNIHHHLHEKPVSQNDSSVVSSPMSIKKEAEIRSLETSFVNISELRDDVPSFSRSSLNATLKREGHCKRLENHFQVNGEEIWIPQTQVNVCSIRVFSLSELTITCI
jgi:hypothetical protein